MAPRPPPLTLSAYGLTEEEEERWGEEGRWAARSAVAWQEESGEDSVGAAVPPNPIPEPHFPGDAGRDEGTMAAGGSDHFTCFISAVDRIYERKKKKKKEKDISNPFPYTDKKEKKKTQKKPKPFRYRHTEVGREVGWRAGGFGAESAGGWVGGGMGGGVGG